jgi:hypothetical protein
MRKFCVFSCLKAKQSPRTIFPLTIGADVGPTRTMATLMINDCLAGLSLDRFDGCSCCSFDCRRCLMMVVVAVVVAAMNQKEKIK